MDQLCAECQTPSARLVAARGGEGVCPECAAAHYVACSDCGALVPRDESRERDGCAYCVECHDRLFAPKEDPESTVDVDELVTEFIRLDAEAKRIGERLDAIKELLKATAATRERIAGAVTLGTGESTVKCSYSVAYKPDAEGVDAIEKMLDPERFAELFERTVTVKTVKANVERLLDGKTDDDPEVIQAVRSIVDVVETPRLTAQRPKKSKTGGEDA